MKSLLKSAKIWVYPTYCLLYSTCVFTFLKGKAMSRLRNDDFIPLPTAKNLKPLELPDCIYLSTRCRCDILCVRECIGETCAFLKTARQRRESCRKWRRALSKR